MINLPITAFLCIAGPRIAEIFKDIVATHVTEGELNAVKMRLYALAADMTRKTHFTWDDDLANAILDALFKPGVFAVWGNLLLDVAEEWVKLSATQWDDVALKPVFEAFRAVAGIPDGER